MALKWLSIEPTFKVILFLSSVRYLLIGLSLLGALSLKADMRIVSLAPNITETLFDLHAGNQLVGRTHFCIHPSETQAIDDVGSIINPDIEKILDLEPDLVLASSLTSPSTLNQFRKHGIEAQYFTTETIQELSSQLISLAQLLNRNQEAQEIARALENLTHQEPKRNLSSLILFDPQCLYAAGKKTWLNDVFAQSGLINIISESFSPWPQLSFEFILKKDPQTIFIVASNKQNSIIEQAPPALISYYQKHPLWSELSAVTEGHIYIISSQWASICSPNRILSLASTLSDLPE